MFTVGQKVRLVADEGLDTPHEHQGTIGVVTRVHRVNPTTPSYDVTFANGDVAYCEEYHVELPYQVRRIIDDEQALDVTLVEVGIDDNLGDLPYVVAIANDASDALTALSQTFDVPRDQLQYELDEWQMKGNNDVIYFDVVAYSSSPVSIIDGMAYLEGIGYDIAGMVEEYFLP